MADESITVKLVGRGEGEARPTSTRWSYEPAIDVLETEDETIIMADVPGAKAEDLDISFEDGLLTLHAHVRQRPHEDRSEIVHEFGVGDFDRQLQLAIPVDPERIRAELGLGTLTLHLPKPEHVKPRRIPVRNV
jgi:HSP20 family molecular chaperone IbpA